MSLSTAPSPRRRVMLTARGGRGYAGHAMRPAGISPESTDTELVSALARGEQRALAWLYQRYAGLLLAVGLKVLGHRREAEDVLHDVFVEAWRNAAQFDPSRGTVRAWLVTRMRSRAMDRRKSPAFSRGLGLEDVGPERAAPEVDPDAGRERSRLSDALGGLSEQQRRVVELAYFDGLTSPEIAQRLGIPVGTVKSRTAAAMARLRVVLGEGT